MARKAASRTVRTPARGLILCALLVLAAVLPGIARPACKPTWTSTSPLPAGNHATFMDVAAVGQNDVWAVGSYQFNGEYVERPLIQHWDGVSWRIVPSPVPATPALPGMRHYARLTGVAAVSANDVWAVGVANGQALIEHWDGTSWSIFPTPAWEGLAEIAAASATDIWAVGAPGFVHWNGLEWQVVSDPDTALKDVVAVAANDAWAVGYTNPVYLWRPIPLVHHWDGTAWTPVGAANAAGGLEAIAAASASSVWTAGSLTPLGYSGLATGGIVDHWDGAGWSAAPIPAVPYLRGIAASSAGDVWAIGPTANSPAPATSALHWDGYAWASVPTTIPTVRITASPSGEFWAVGSKPNTRPTAAVLCPMRVSDTGFSAKSAKAAQGATVAWSFAKTNARAHSVYDASLGLFDSGLRGPATSFLRRFTFAGQYTIRDAAATTFKTTIAVPVVTKPATGSTATVYTITWASAARPSDHVFDVQVKRPGSLVWSDWRTAETATSDTFAPDGLGTYTFRARLRETVTGRAAAWSQPAGISVRA